MRSRRSTGSWGRSYLTASLCLAMLASGRSAAEAAPKAARKAAPKPALKAAPKPAPKPALKSAPQPTLKPALDPDEKARVVVLPFEGLNGGKARAAVVRGLGRSVRVLGVAAYAGEARRQRVDGGTASGIVAVCARLRCSAVIKGTVTKVAAPAPAAAARNEKGTGKTPAQLRLELVVLDGASGKPLGTQASPGLSPKVLGAAVRSLGALCLPLVARGSYRRAAPPKSGLAGGKGGSGAQPPAVASAPAPAPAAAESVLPDTEDTPEALAAPKPAPPAPPRPGLRERWAGLGELSVGVGVTQRRFELRAPTAAGNRTFDGSPFPEFALHAEIYPLAPLTRRFVRNLGVALDYSRHLVVSTDLPANGARPETCAFGSEVATRSQQLLADLVLRWPLGLSTPFSPTFGVSAGFGLREFALGPNDVLTGFNYRFVRVALAGRLPLGTRLAALELGGDLRPLFGVGQDAVDALGERSSGLAWSVHGGLRGELRSGLFYFARAEYQRYAVELAGLDAAGEPLRPCTPDNGDPTSGNDSYLRLTAGAGYQL